MVAFPLLCLITRGYPPVKTKHGNGNWPCSSSESRRGGFCHGLVAGMMWLQRCTSLVSYLRASWWQSKATLTKVSGFQGAKTAAFRLRLKCSYPQNEFTVLVPMSSLRILHGTSWNHKTKGYGPGMEDHLTIWYPLMSFVASINVRDTHPNGHACAALRIGCYGWTRILISRVSWWKMMCGSKFNWQSWVVNIPTLLHIYEL